MKILFQAILSIIILFSSAALKPIVSYTVLTKHNKKILILSDLHHAEFNTIHEAHAQALIDKVFVNKAIGGLLEKQVPVFIEENPEFLATCKKTGIYDKTAAIATWSATARVLGKFALSQQSAIAQKSIVDIIPADIRGKESVVVTSLFNSESAIYKIIMGSLNKSLALQALSATESMTELLQLPLIDFYNKIAVTAQTTQQIFGKQSMIYQKYEQAIKAIKQQLAKADLQKEFLHAVINALKESHTLIGLQQRYFELKELLIQLIDVGYEIHLVQIGLQKLNSGHDKIIYIASYAQLDQLVKFFKLMGFTVSSTESVFFSDASCGTGALDVDKFEKFSEKFIPITQNFLVDNSQLASAIQLPDTIKKSCNSCKKQENANQKLKCCGKCKVVWYCSVECQKTDWKLHKLACAKPVAAANATTAAGTTSESAKATSNSSDGKSTTISNSGKYLVVSKK